MAGDWLREEQADLAVHKILDAASAAFAEIGVPAASMADVARFAGCSRGTLYRYFRNRHELYVAYVDRAARELATRVAEGLAGIGDPRMRLIEGILRSVHEVRATPATAAWFAPGGTGIAAGMSGASDVIEALAAAFVTRLVAGEDDPDNRLRARWLVRVIVSLLAMPGADEHEERALVERFVAPSVLAADTPRI